MIKLRSIVLAALIGAFVVGCPSPQLPETGTGESDDGTVGEDGEADDEEGTSGGDVGDSALNYGGSVSGSVLTASATDGEPNLESGRKYFSRMQGSGATAWLTDLAGNRLKDAAGEQYPKLPVNADGTFLMEDLPVGVDIMLNVDLDGDGEADLQTIINIPQDEDDETGGTLDGAVVDPLSTLTGAKLAQILEEWGVDPDELELSASGLIGQTRDAYENLLDSAGISSEIDVEDVLGMSPEELADLFEELVPEGARNSMKMAHHRVGMTVAADVEDVVQAVAQILLEGGMVISDEPGGVDLSCLADLPNVESMTFDEFFGQQFHGGMPGPPPGDFDDEFDEDMPPPDGGEPWPPEFAQAIPEVDFSLYVHTAAEVDRNFAAEAEDMMPGMKGPMIGEYVLVQMAEAYLEGKTISLEQLHHILTEPTEGLGIRLTYTTFSNDPREPPVEVFETLDGKGVEKDIFGLMDEIMDMGMFDPSPEAFERQEAKLREALVDFLKGTAAPPLEKLLDGILMERVPSADEFARITRDRRVHIPWSLSGPSQMWVVATGDPWGDRSAAAVTVDAVTDARGRIETVTYNTGGAGEFYLAQLWPTDGGQMVELVRCKNGRPLHDHEGFLQQVDMAYAGIFQPIRGQSFFETFSETEVEWPLAPELTVPNAWFDPSRPPDPIENPPDFQELVLMSDYGPDATPVMVAYDELTGAAVAGNDGGYYLVADELFWEDGWFMLIESSGEFLADVPGDWESRVRIDPESVQALPLQKEVFTWVYGIDVPNPAYDPEGAPYWDDINDDGVQQPDEPVFSERHSLWDPSDWMSTWVERYYRRADNDGFPNPEDIDWGAHEPRLLDGTALVPRNFRARQNGWRFGRPNLAVNLLVTFSPPEFFNGTQALNGKTRVNALMTMALVSLILDSTHVAVAKIDFDGPGPLPEQFESVPAYFFVPPVGDPVQLIADGFAKLAE